MIRIATVVTVLVLINVCTVSAETFVRDDINTNPQPSDFTICHGGTCEEVEHVVLAEQQWQQIRRLFNDNSSAREERENIKRAIALLERIVGQLTDTYNDKAENKTDYETNHYMDCIDESTNTTIYLMLLVRDGLLTWHTVEDRGNRGYFFNGWPHTTAVIKEKQTGQRYAVDSWFRDNGLQPYIIPFTKWKAGWRP